VESVEAPGAPFGGRWESWDALFAGDRQVGYSHVLAEPVDQTPSSQVRFTLESRLQISQGRSRMLQRLTQTSLESNDGRLIGFQAELQVGPALTRFEGSVRDAMLELVTIRGHEREVRRTPWQADFRGLNALEQSLLQRPLRAVDERRTLRMLLPGQYQLATARLTCTGPASVPLIDGTLAELLESECEIELDGQRSYSMLWTDQAGQILRTYSPALRLFAYRTDEATGTKIDWEAWSVASIAVQGRGIQRPNESGRVTYRVIPKAAGTSASSITIEPAPGQYVRAVEDGSFQVLVSRESEVLESGFQSSDLVPTAADSQPNPIVDSDAEFIRKCADAAITSQGQSNNEIAMELVRAAHQLTAARSEASGFSKASEVAQRGVGDAVDRAVLLTALLRARNLPARLAIGFQYQPDRPATEQAGTDPDNVAARMNFHAWTLVHVEGQWLHLDATTGGLAAADRLIVSTTDLGGPDAHRALLPFLDRIGRIEIEVVAQD
jgi:transglutaminase-like putative cysteine protease